MCITSKESFPVSKLSSQGRIRRCLAVSQADSYASLLIEINFGSLRSVRLSLRKKLCQLASVCTLPSFQPINCNTTTSFVVKRHTFCLYNQFISLVLWIDSHLTVPNNLTGHNQNKSQDEYT